MTERPTPLDLRDVPGAPASGTVLATLDELRENEAKPFDFRHGSLLTSIFVLRKGGKLFAYENTCPHVRLPLDWVPGQVMDDQRKFLYCANHHARFRVEDGFCVSGPCFGKWLRPVKVTEKDGAVSVA